MEAEARHRPSEQEAQPKATRLMLVFEDGRIRVLEGADLDKYLEHINKALTFVQATRRHLLPSDFLEVEWKELDVREAAGLLATPDEKARRAAMRRFDEARERDFAAYDRLKDEIVTKYLGQYVAIADGRLVKVAPTYAEAREAVKQYQHHLVFEAGDEPDIGIVYIR